MSVSIKPLISSKYAASSVATEYTSTGQTIIDKFTATNITAGAITLTIHLVPTGDSASNANMLIQALSIAAGATTDITELQNHILGAGEFIAVVASAGSSIVIRSSGREDV